MTLLLENIFCHSCLVYPLFFPFFEFANDQEVETTPTLCLTFHILWKYHKPLVLHPVFWCDYVPTKPHPNLHKTGSLYYELYYWERKKTTKPVIIFRPLWNPLYQMERNCLICSDTDVRTGHIICEYIIWINTCFPVMWEKDDSGHNIHMPLKLCILLISLFTHQAQRWIFQLLKKWCCEVVESWVWHIFSLSLS